MKDTKNTYNIKNLNCPGCALKIEKKIKELDCVSFASIDLVNNKLSITSSSETIDILKTINQIVDRIEPGTKITEVVEETEEGRKVNLISIISGFILFLLAYFNLFTENITTVLFIVSYAFVGYKVIYKAFKNISRGNLFDENFLMVMATFAAVYVKSYPEAVAVMLFYEIGEFFQDLALNRSRKSIKELIDIQPKFAHLKQDNQLSKVEPSEVKVNDIIIVKPGEKIPLDGIIIEGQSSVDSSQLTGESIPKNVEVDDEVLAGFINYNGLLTIKVTKKYEDTAVNKILELVQNAQSKKAKVEKFITKFAKIYTPIVILLAVLTVLLPMFFVPTYQFDEYLYRGAIFLVVSCPCALVISIPLSIFGGIGASSKQGILIKGGNYLDVIRNVGIVVFDKTGTLTKGNFVVTKVIPLKNNLEKMVERTIYAESLSNHAISKAIVKYQSLTIDQSKIKSFEEIFGRGVHAVIENDDVLAGNAKLMIDNHISFSEVNEVGTIVYVAINHTYVGYFVIEDEIKQEAKNTIHQLKKLGVSKTLMLTGDSQKVAEHVGNALSIDRIHANLLPEDKLQILESLKAENSNTCVMFVGDGVNDTPVMTLSDVGVAMGALGSDAAIETSDVVIMNDDLSKLIDAKKLAHITHKKVWQNITFALGVKFFVLALSAFGLANMWEAVFADVGVTLLAVLNSILILKYKTK
ncbi:cadmium-translocating P-type ATPase [Mycoplasmatota bacterium]|nr:cadmium-translocating P-type ATPase [Mycoplasmatota bacterium]